MEDEVKTSIRKQYLIAGCLYLGQTLVGYSMGTSAPLLAKLQKPEESPLENAITDGEASWMISVSFVGIVLGPYLSGYFSNVIGRKPCLLFGGTFFVLSFILMAVAKSLPLIYVGRCLAGVGTGILFVVSLVYIGEMASTKIRGILLTLTGMSSASGILTAYSMGSYLSYANIHWAAVFLGVEFVVAVYFLVPETAVYQVMKGNKQEAMAILKSLGREDDIDEIIAKANEKPKSKMAQLTEMYTVRSNRKAAFILIALAILSQLSGMIVLISFVTIIFDMTGSNMESHISTIIIGVTQVFASIIAPVLVDRVGRKILLLVSSAFCSISLTSLGIFFYLYNNGHPVAEHLQWLPLVSLMVLCIAYYSGLGIIPNTFIGEMFTDTCRGFGGTITITIGFMFGFAVTTSFGYILPAWGPSVVFWIFSGSCAFTFFFTIVFVPETKGKSLLEIQELLNK